MSHWVGWVYDGIRGILSDVREEGVCLQSVVSDRV